MSEKAGKLRGARSSLAIVALCFSVTGCNAVYEYPAATAEVDEASCANGSDDDFDGRIDCDDPDCDGWCSEDDATRCADGRDNDGDGWKDSEDPRCWHLAAPSVVRCASTDPLDFEERFDTSILESRWHLFGLRTAVVGSPIGRADRTDSVLAFTTLPASGQEATGLVSAAAFDGDWHAFSLRFSARASSSSLLRVALVPTNISRAGHAPAAGAEEASLVVEVDANGSPTVRLGVQGQQYPNALPDGFDWHDFQLVASGEQLELLVDGVAVLEVTLPALPPSRLAVWGQQTAQSASVQLDDLLFQIAGSRPCGVADPKIPFGQACHLDPAVLSTNAGYSVSVAPHEVGGYCALITASSSGQDRPNTVQGWRSDDGATWEFGRDLPLSQGKGTLVGAGLARDATAGLWRAAIAWHEGAAVRLSTTTSGDCIAWVAPQEAAVLPPDAEAPSYLVPGLTSAAEIYFTRPGTDTDGPTLWRLSSSDGAAFVPDASPVTAFPADSHIQGPTSLSRASVNDVVLVHRISTSTGMLGLGLWVAENDDLAVWRRSARWPLLVADPDRGGFDGDAVLSGSVVWEHSAPFLLYGALGQPLASYSTGGSAPTVTTGTALIVAGGTETQSGIGRHNAASTPRPGLCGDNACDGFEDCATCAVDCGVCDGKELLADRFDELGAWEPIAPADNDAFSTFVYVSPTLARLSMVPGPLGWLSRQLDEPLRGDFELSFDVHWTPPSDPVSKDRCTAVVGLGLPGSTDAFDAAGLFVELDQQLPCSGGAPTFTPHLRTGSKHVSALAPLSLVASSGATCVGAVVGYANIGHRVTLTRRRGTIDVAVAAPGICGAPVGATASLAYAGSFDGLQRIVAGWSTSLTPGGYVIDCADKSASVTIDNLLLRLLPCADGAAVCTDPTSGRSFCADLGSTPEHCGACFQEVEPTESCSLKAPVCGGTECPTGGSEHDLLACTDILMHRDHCGACGVEVGPLEDCRHGIPVAKMVSLPDGFAIDATEVTWAQYLAWLRTDPSTVDQRQACAWNQSFEPSCPKPSAELGDMPVVCVDWCDAYGYCAAIGKRLCGRVGGGSLSLGQETSPASQWLVACSAGGANEFVYGATCEPLACNTCEQNLPDSPFACAPLRPVASFSQCQSPEPSYSGVYDLLGNASEWLDACLTVSGADDTCAFVDSNACFHGDHGCSSSYGDVRRRAGGLLGFRCCSY